jgi:hypothetical protein
MTKAIGGYPELELRKGEHYHKDALCLNTARNCFEYILRAKQYTKVYMPYYTCEVMLEPLKKCNVDFEFYHINLELEPIELYELKSTEAFLYTNYYGLKQDCVVRLAEKYGRQLIVDNAQAFFARPLKGIDTFYSARKFFGVADGAYLYTDTILDFQLEKDISYERMMHLLIRADVDAESGYADFRKNDDSLNNNPIRLMSNLTEKILCSIDYDNIKRIRRENYILLDTKLSSSNGISLFLDEESVPMVYPYFTNKILLRKSLIENRIFVAKYWDNVSKKCNMQDVECVLLEQLLPLPINHMSDHENINRIINIISKYESYNKTLD